MNTLNSIILEGKLEIIENEGLCIVYQISGYEYATKIDDCNDKFSAYENREVRVVGKLLGNEISVEHIEIKPIK